MPLDLSLVVKTIGMVKILRLDVPPTVSEAFGRVMWTLFDGEV
jgi:hypothetical protein